MSVPKEPQFPRRTHKPMRELLLAQALEACVTAERQQPGSSEAVIARQPAWARDELRRLLGVAASVQSAAATVQPSAEFRAAARARLMQSIGAEMGASAAPVQLHTVQASSAPSANGYHRPRSARSAWAWRGSVGVLFAAALGVAATLSASASALPGDALYPVKQAQEELSVRLAPDDDTRALALLRQADARLDETQRLLQQGRTDQVAQTTQRFDEVVQRATTTYVLTIDQPSGNDQVSANMDSKLSEQQQHLQALLQTAPEPARPDLREALVVTERGRALVSDQQGTDRGRGRRSEEARAAAPTAAAEELPTPTATARPVVVAVATPEPTAVIVAENHDREPEIAVQPRDSHDRRGEDQQRVVAPQPAQNARSGEHEGESQRDGEGEGNRAPVVTPNGNGNASVNVNPNRGRAPAAPQPVRPSSGNGRGRDNGDQHVDEAPAAPAVVAQPEERNLVETRNDGGRQQEAVVVRQTGGDGGDGGGHGRDGGGDNAQAAQPGIAPQPPTRPAPPPIVTQADRTGEDNTTTDKTDGDGRDGGTRSTQQNVAVRPQTQSFAPTPTPTPSSVRRTSGDGRSGGGDGGGGNTSTSTTTTTTTRTTTSTSGGGDGGGGDGGGGGGHRSGDGH